MIDPADNRTIPLFPESLAELKKLCSGELYLPSNGTEGDIFVANWCVLCSNLNLNDDAFGCNCPIYLNSMIGNVPEWIIDANGQPKCTAFQEETN